jgi:hypothetical protein
MEALSVGQGHCPLMPMTGRTSSPSGLALTQVIAQLYVTVFARMVGKQRDKAMKKFKGSKAIIATVQETALCGIDSKNPVAAKHCSYAILGT